MDEDFLVFLEPGIEGVPVEPHGSGQPGQRVVAVDPRAAGPGEAAGPKPVPPCRTTVQLLRMLLVDQHGGFHVGDRDVVLRVVRPLPHVQRSGGVQYYRAAEHRADPARYRLDVIDRRDHLWVVSHGNLPVASVRGPRGGRPGWSASRAAYRREQPVE